MHVKKIDYLNILHFPIIRTLISHISSIHTRAFSFQHSDFSFRFQISATMDTTTRTKTYHHRRGVRPTYVRPTFHVNCTGCTRRLSLPLPASDSAQTKCECGTEPVTFKRCSLCPDAYYSTGAHDTTCRKCIPIAANCRACDVKFSMTMWEDRIVYRKFGDNYCKTCGMNKKCESCGVSFVATTSIATKCAVCALNKFCTDCHKSFVANDMSTNQCGTCTYTRSVRKFVCSHGVTGNFPIYPDLLLQLIYETSNPHHDGYCSDPGEITYRKTTSKKTYPLLRLFKKSDIDDDNSVDIHNLKLWTYYPCQSESRCTNGSGYCGSRCSSCATSARVIKKSDMIVLDD